MYIRIAVPETRFTKAAILQFSFKRFTLNGRRLGYVLWLAVTREHTLPSCVESVRIGLHGNLLNPTFGSFVEWFREVDIY